MIVIAGTIDLADPDRMDECIEGALELQRSAREDEPGCLAYVFVPDPLVRGRIHVHELWQDEASLAAHFAHPNYKLMRRTLGAFGLTAFDVHKYRVDLREPVYDADFRPRADFFTAPAD
jgi:quinol monooxygenase YgiN